MLYKYAVLFLLITLSAGVAKAESSGDEPWREEMKKLIYSSRYFGPNALHPNNAFWQCKQPMGS